MLRETIASAATVEEAKAKALLELGLSEDICDLEIEVLVFPEKKKLGLFGGKNAEVRVSYDDGKPEPKPAKKAEKPEAKKPAEAKPTKKTDKPVKTDAPKKSEKPVKADKPAKVSKVSSAAADKIVAYVRDILSHMDVGEYTLETEEIDGSFHINLTGDGLGVVIGRRGETLDALQYLISLSGNNDSENKFVRIVLDANNYRSKREKTLTELALKVGAQVLETRRNRSLEPMNPYERRVIHTAIQTVDGVTSWSVSDGNDRRVIVGICNEDGTPADPDYKPFHRSGGRNDRRGDSRRGGRPRREAPRYESSAPKRDKRSDAGDLPLFGRIDNK